MKYEELCSKQKQYVNGVVSKFMDTYIRNHFVWTPEQMYLELYKEIKKRIKEEEKRNIEFVDDEFRISDLKYDLWIVSYDAKEYIMEKYKKKYNQNNKLARKDSPLVERARFGIDWGKNYYDINWGLKNNNFDYEKANIVENNDMIPWSIEHVEYELMKKYNKNLENVLSELSTSYIEKKFYEKWLSMYYNEKKNPALIPEFCGTRQRYWCYKDNKDLYFLNSGKDRMWVNVRYDFAVINYSKQKKLLIELDGYQYHMSKIQQNHDSIKRSIATNNGWQMNVITGIQIKDDIYEVFDSMDDFFCYE